MKFSQSFLHLALLFVISGESVTGGDVPIVTLDLLGERYKIKITKENLKRSEWDQESQLPLAIEKIIEIARGEVSRKYPEKKRYLLDSLKLNSYLDEKNHWYYLAVFVNSNVVGSPRGGAGSPRVVMLLLDGTVINPEKNNNLNR
jgi:hypothetical protein